MGIVSEVLPTFARKPLFGYPVVVFSGVAIGFMGWGVWAHHMFVVGLGPVANAAFATSTMLIAVPTGVKIFNWLGTIWGGRVVLRTPMAFAIGFVAMFIIGGLSGVSHAVARQTRSRTTRTHHRPLPLRAIRRCYLRPLLRHLLLVAQIHRQVAR
ncbi:MAG: cbb3-type cytochrome c oxidase subunit I [Dehalococcoidia bacterium]